MSSVIKLSPSIKEILDVFLKYNFQPLTIKQIANELGPDVDVNTINQRIIRDENTIFESKDTKPKKITIKRGVKEVVFYRDNNQCFMCRRMVSPKLLSVHVINEDVSDLQAWENLVSICADCTKNPPPTELKKKPGEERSPRQNTSRSGDIWEYLTVFIRSQVGSESEGDNSPSKNVFSNLALFQAKSFIYYEFIEVLDINHLLDDQWIHLVDNDEEETKTITSRSITDVLNEFGSEGWELAFMQQMPDDRGTNWGFFQFPFQSRKLNPFGTQGILGSSPDLPPPETVKCVFKKKVLGRQ